MILLFLAAPTLSRYSNLLWRVCRARCDRSIPLYFSGNSRAACKQSKTQLITPSRRILLLLRERSMIWPPLRGNLGTNGHLFAKRLSILKKLRADAGLLTKLEVPLAPKARVRRISAGLLLTGLTKHYK